jgi:iron-sulfur cluster repair protein YtfE (RIC family)
VTVSCPAPEEVTVVTETLTTTLEREHHEIDAGIEAFLGSLSHGEPLTAELFRAVEALRRHIYLEEEFLFPPLRAAGLLPPVLVMLREHGEIWRTLDAVAALDPAVSPDDVRRRCDDLLALLAAHNAKEEPIIYPQGDHVLTDEAKHDLHAFIDSGEMPDGWVCAQA